MILIISCIALWFFLGWLGAHGAAKSWYGEFKETDWPRLCTVFWFFLGPIGLFSAIIATHGFEYYLWSSKQKKPTIRKYFF